MTNDTIKCETYIEQVRDGEEYRGYLDLDGVRFSYTMGFDMHLDRLGELAAANPIRALKHIKLDVKDSQGNPVVLEEGSAKNLFYGTLIPFVIGFYCNSQTRDSNEGLIGQLLEGRGPFAEHLGVRASIGMTKTGSFKRTPELEKIVGAYRK